MNLNDELEILIDKYKVSKYYKRVYKNYNIVKNVIINIFNDIHVESKIAIRGGGVHTKELLKIISEDIKIECIIDKNPSKEKIRGINVISLKEFIKDDFDIVIISSFAYRNEIKKELFDMGYSGRIIDIYDYLEMNNISIENPFYENLEDARLKEYSAYIEVFNIRKAYEYFNENKEYYLQKVIEIYLEIRDFIYAEKFIKEYIDKKYKNYENYQLFLYELKELLNKVREKIKKRKQEDIYIFYIDALRTKDIDNCKNLKSVLNKSVVFNNSFTIVGHTKNVIKNIFTGKLPIDDHLFELSKVCLSNSKLIQYLKEKDIDLRIIETDKIEPIYDEKLLTKNFYACAPAMYWNLLNELIASDKRCVAMIHTIYESHEPYVCGYRNNEMIDYRGQFGKLWDFVYNGGKVKDFQYDFDLSYIDEQFKSSMEYLDKQLNFYLDFLGENSTRIFLSDHGKVEPKDVYFFFRGVKKMDCFGWNDLFLRNVLFIHNNKLKPQIINKLYSLENLSDIIYNLINDKNTLIKNLPNQKYITFQLEDMYDCLISRGYIESGNAELGISYRGVRTENEKYVLDRYGKERYYLLPNEVDNQIGEIEYQERVKQLRKWAGNYFIDITKYDKFKYSVELNDVYLKSLEK